MSVYLGSSFHVVFKAMRAADVPKEFQIKSIESHAKVRISSNSLRKLDGTGATDSHAGAICIDQILWKTAKNSRFVTPDLLPLLIYDGIM